MHPVHLQQAPSDQDNRLQLWVRLYSASNDSPHRRHLLLLLHLEAKLILILLSSGG